MTTFKGNTAGRYIYIKVFRLIWQHVSKQLLIYTSGSYRETLSLIWSHVCVPLMNPSPTSPHLLCIWSPPAPEGKNYLFICYNHRYAHQLVSDSGHLGFGAK